MLVIIFFISTIISLIINYKIITSRKTKDIFLWFILLISLILLPIIFISTTLTVYDFLKPITGFLQDNALAITEIILGLVLGVLINILPKWQIVANPPGKWRMATFLVALSSIIVLALLVPYANVIFARMSGLKIANAEFQFNIPKNEVRALQETDRHLFTLETFNDIARSDRQSLNFDCGFQALKDGGIKNFKKKHPKTYLHYAYWDAFMEKKLFPFLEVNSIAKSQGYDISVLRWRAIGLQDRLVYLLTVKDKENILGKVKELRDYIDSQVNELSKIVNHDKYSSNKTLTNNLYFCHMENNEEILNNDQLFIDTLNSHNFIRHFTSRLLISNGNTLAAIHLMKDKYDENHENIIFEDDFNFFWWLARAKYFYNSKDYEDVNLYLNKALKIIDLSLRLINEKKSNNQLLPIDKSMTEKLILRYQRASLENKLYLAYLWTQVHMYEKYSTAGSYAEENYAILNKLPPYQESIFPCLDADRPIRIQDIYAYVNLEIEARNANNKSIFPDAAKVQKMIDILENAKSDLKNLKEENKSDTCHLDEEREKLWQQKLDSHLEYARSLLK